MIASLNTRLADCLSGLRAERGWTLDELAGISGVSRAALSRLENGEVSPSADVLSRLASAHGVSLSRLVSKIEEGFTSFVPRTDQPVWRDTSTGYSRRMVSPGSTGLAMELLECKLPPGTELNYDAPEIAGQEHHVIMLSGYLRVEMEGECHDLGPGDALRYRQFGPARFTTSQGQGARYMMCLQAR